MLDFQSEGWQAEHRGKLMMQMKFKGGLLENLLLLRGARCEAKFMCQSQFPSSEVLQ